MEVRKLGLNARASCKPVRRQTPARPCGARRSLATERNPSKRGCRGICSLAKWLREPGFSAGIRRVDAWPFYYVIEMWSSVFASQQYSMPMSQLGQSRHFGRAPITSGLHPEADIFKFRRHVGFVPNADFPTKLSAGSQMEH